MFNKNDVIYSDEKGVCMATTLDFIVAGADEERW